MSQGRTLAAALIAAAVAIGCSGGGAKAPPTSEPGKSASGQSSSTSNAPRPGESPAKADPSKPSSPKPREIITAPKAMPPSGSALFVGRYKPSFSGDAARAIEQYKVKAANGDKIAATALKAVSETEMVIRKDGTWTHNMGNGMTFSGTYIANENSLVLYAISSTGREMSDQEREPQIFSYNPETQVLDAQNNTDPGVVMKKVK